MKAKTKTKTMLRRRLTVFALALATLSPLAARAQEIGDTGSPEGFVREVYKPYERRAAPRDFTLRDGVPIFSKRFRALVLKDRAQAGGEIGLIEGDPLCQCQDVVTFRVTKVHVGGDDRIALVDVSYRNGGDSGTLKLVLANGDYGWLIDDITTADVPSYRTILKSQLR
ncbi:DUF3828 domain-containing protein [Hansschlegelia sp. KR7-227]|uniref:DUF3828 domain-containing protein n=1 Tax=Hansschlegelia sp. KR7-227 TaxID=3400914 RepID=UPI003C0F0492